METPKITPRLGVPNEARLQDQRLMELESESRRYSNLTPGGRIESNWQFAQRLTQRQWSVGGMVALWLVMGLPALALLVAGALNALARSTPAERAWGIFQACLIPGIPLLALSVLTRKWLKQRAFAQAVRRRN